MHVQNLSNLAFSGWLPSTTVATLAQTEGIVSAIRYVAGPDIGLSGRGKHVDLQLTIAAGAEVHEDLATGTLQSYDATARNAIAADPINAVDGLGAVPTMCGETLAVLSATSEGAGVLIHCRGRIASMLLVDCWIRKYPGQHFAFVEVAIHATNPAVPAMFGTVPADCVLRITGATSSFQAGATVTDHTVLLPQGEHLADGQMRQFTGVVYWPSRISALGGGAAAVNNSINAYRTGLVGAVDEGWADKIGPLQKVAQAGSNFSAAAWVAKNFGPARQRLTNWDAGNLSLAAGYVTGAQGDQGFGGKGTACFLAGGGPVAATTLYWDALGNARRTCHHREADGTLLSTSAHPNLFLWDGRPDPRNGTDMLGKPRQLADNGSESHGWYGGDEEHIFCLTLAAAYQLTGSRALQLTLECWARNYFYQRGTTGAAARNGADRAIGWMALLVATLYPVLRDRTLADAMKTRAVDHFTAVTLPAISGKAVWQPRSEGNLLADIWRNQSGANPYAQVFFAYQAAQAAGCLWIFGHVLGVAAAKSAALTAALGVLDRAYSQHPPSPGDSRGRWVEWDFVGHPATGAPLPASAFVEGAGAHRAPTGQALHLPGWFASAWFPFAAWVVLREQPAHARANSIWAQITADLAASTEILEWIPPVTPEQAAAAPTGLQAAATETQVALTWVDNASTEDHYEVERADPATMAWAVIASPAANATSYTDTGVSIGQALAYRVAAVTAGGLRSYSAVVQVVIPGLPTAPAALAAVAHASEARIDLGWPDASAGRDSFLVQWSSTGTSGWADLATVPAGRSTHSDTSVPRGTRRWYRVAARYQNLQSAWSPVASAQTAGLLTPPTGLTATAHATLPQVALAWSNPTNGALSVEIQHSPNSAGPWAVLATVSATAFAHTDTTIGYGQTRHYRAVVRNAVGPSGPSNVASATAAAGLPAAPTGLTVTPHATLQRLTLAWTPAAGVTAQEVERSPNGETGWVALDAGAAAVGLDDNAVLYGQTWFYRVRGVNAQGAGPWTAAVAGTVFHGLPAAPASPAAQAHVSDPQITVSWSLGSSVTEILGHEVQRSADGSTGWARLDDELAAGATSYVDTALTTGQAASYRVRARNAQGWGAWSTVVSATTAGVPPAPVLPEPGSPDAPSLLVAAAPEAPGQIDLTWQDNASNEVTQEIQRSVVSADGPWFPRATLGPNDEDYSDTELLPSQQAWYRIRAVNGAGPSLWSNVATATASAEDTTYEDPVDPEAPAAPSNLTATAHATDPEVTLEWDDNSDDETGFDLQRGAVPALPATEIQWATVATPTLNVESYLDAAVQPGQVLAYRVRAVNAAGPSDWSAIAYATVAGREPPHDPATPTGLTATAHASLDHITLEWDVATVEPGAVVEVQRSANGVDGWADLPAPPANTPQGQYVDGGTGWAATWFYRIRAVLAGRPSLQWSAVASATTVQQPGPTAPPSMLRARLRVGTTVTDVTWQDNASNEIYFLLQRSSDGGRTWVNAAQPGEIGPNVEAWEVDDGG